MRKAHLSPIPSTVAAAAAVSPSSPVNFQLPSSENLPAAGDTDSLLRIGIVSPPKLSPFLRY